MALCSLGATQADSGFALDALTTVGWAATTVVVTLLLVIRPHEKKLLGSYRMQANWLGRNRPALIQHGYFLVEAKDSDQR